jgi:hypothetical protein
MRLMQVHSLAAGDESCFGCVSSVALMDAGDESRFVVCTVVRFMQVQVRSLAAGDERCAISASVLMAAGDES